MSGGEKPGLARKGDAGNSANAIRTGDGDGTVWAISAKCRSASGCV